MSCGFSEGKKEAEELAEEMFYDLKANNYDNLSIYFSDKFFQDTSLDRWIKMLKNINKKLGHLESFELQKWSTKKGVHTSGSGTLVNLQYNVKYIKYPAVVTISIVKPIGGDMKIRGFNINSIGFMEE